MPDSARSSHPGVQHQLDRLAALSPGGDRLGLERITALLDRLGRPQDRLPPVFHVAGTNGKGSTCAFLRAALEAAGHRVHVFTSPHLVRFNERIRLAGRLIDDELLAALLAEVLDASSGIEPSFFEASTAAAFLGFSRVPADALVLEVGMGGRLDATNVVERPAACGIAALGLDHQQWLGPTITAIAGEKAGIARRGVPLLTERYQRPAAERIGAVAAAAGAQWLPRGQRWDATPAGDHLLYRDPAGELSLPPPRLPGRHQAMNAALAIAMLRHQGEVHVPDAALTAALNWTEWPARMQRLAAGPLVRDREVWLDGAHNANAAGTLAQTARQVLGRPFHLVFASLRTKDPEAMLSAFTGLAEQVGCVSIPQHDCFAPDELAELARRLGFDACAYPDVPAALAALPTDQPTLVMGSLYLAGEVLRLNDQAPD